MSRHLLDCCIVFDGIEAKWVTPSHAVRLMEADPRVELIEELHPYFEDYAQLAGPKPEKYVEDQGAKVEGDDNDGGTDMPEGDPEGVPLSNQQQPEGDVLDSQKPDPGPRS